MNSLIWTVGLMMQILLLATLLRGRLARRLPFFTALIAFYIVRSVFLHVSSGLMEDDAYALCGQALSLVDLLFQILVAWELFRGGRGDQAARTQAAPFTRQAFLFGAMLVGSAALAWGLSALDPLNRSKHFDRGVIFTSALMLLVAACALFWRKTTQAAAARRALAGYALLAAATISAQVGKTFAEIQRNSDAYYGWSYVAVVAYLAVLGFWLIALQVVSPRPLLKRPRKTVAGAAC